MTLRKIFLSVALLATLLTLIPQPASAELSDEAKIERCHNNLARITSLQLEAERLKASLAPDLEQQEALAGKDLDALDDVLNSDEAFWAFFDNLNMMGDDLNLYDRWLKPYDVQVKKEHIHFVPPEIERNPDDDSTPSAGDVARANNAQFKANMTLLLKDLQVAVADKIQKLEAMRADQATARGRLKEIDELLAYHRGGLERWNCRELLKTGEVSVEDALKPDPGVWALVEVISDPADITRAAKYKETVWLPTATETETMQTNLYELKHQTWTDASQSKRTVDFHINVQWEPPPATIKPGENFSLKVTGSCTKSTEDMGGWVARWGIYEAGGGIDVKMTASSMDKPYVGLGDAGFVGHANATYTFTVPEAEKLSSEFVIEQKGAAIFKYKKGGTPIVVKP